jgi:hypothetical protein
MAMAAPFGRIEARDLVVAVRALGFDPGETWYRVPRGDDRALGVAFDAMVADLRAGVASIVCMHFDERPDTTEHFRLVTGYDAHTDEVVYNDPALDDGLALRMSRARFLQLWPLHYGGDDTLVRLRLAGTPVAPVASEGPTAADLAQAVMVAREKIGDEPGFTLVVQPPWVVVGDLDADAVRARATGTVEWTTNQLRRDYFAKDPADAWTIWLFADDESYTRHAKAFFGDEPDTPYGYADSGEHALIMNIGTGGGTLVHEMVHPFIGANLPDCPAWINEGLASLYEHVGEEDGHIWGYTNWRLRGLKAAIRAGDVPSLRWLTATTWEQFYAEERGVNYAMARYLMQYMQEKGKLRPFMAAYAKNRATDPTGYQTLIETLGVTDVARFTTEWEAWAMALEG